MGSLLSHSIRPGWVLVAPVRGIRPSANPGMVHRLRTLACSGRSRVKAAAAMNMPAALAARKVCAPTAVPTGPASAYPDGLPALGAQQVEGGEPGQHGRRDTG